MNVLPCAGKSKIVATAILLLIAISIVLILVYVVLPNNESGSGLCQVRNPPPDISFTHYGVGSVKVSWNTYLDDVDCGVTYYLLFRYEGVEWNFHTADNFVILGSLHECSVLMARIWSLSSTGQSSKNYTENEFDVTPPNQVVSVITTEEWGDAISVTWHRPESLNRCNVTYNVTYSSQLASEESIVEDPAHLIIPFEKFCFKLVIQIKVLVNSELNSVTSLEYNGEAQITGYRVQGSLEEPQEIIFTWDNHPKEDICSLQYRVSYRTGTDENVIVSTVIPEARFPFVYCQDAWIYMSVSTSTGDIADTTISGLRVTQTPNNVVEINGVAIDVDSSEDVMVITWEYPPLADDCYIKYVVNITTDFGTFREMEVIPPIEFSKDKHCVFIQLQILPTHMGLPVISALTELDFDIVPSNVEKIVVNRITDTHLVVSWDPHPKQELCPLQYKIVQIVKGEEVQAVVTKSNSYTFEFNYCVDAQLKISVLIGEHESKSVSIDVTQYPTEIGTVTDVQFIEGIISWMAPSLLEACRLAYVLRILQDNSEAVEFRTVKTKFVDINFCIAFNVTIRAEYNEGVQSDFTDVYTFIEEFPRDAPVTNIQFATSGASLSVTWARPAGTDACDISYWGLGTGDLDTFSSLLDTERFNILYDVYCFKVSVVITTMIGDTPISTTIDGYEEEEIIQRVNFAISSENPQELIIGWNNHREYDLCALDYHVVHSTLGTVESVNTTQPEARVTFKYCANANVTIQTYGLGRTIVAPAQTFNAIQWPAEIAPVEDITFGDVTNNMLDVSWLSAAYLSYCDIMYTVTAENPIKGEKGTCIGTTGCPITLSDFCPNTEIEIRATLLNNEGISGEVARTTYNC